MVEAAHHALTVGDVQVVLPYVQPAAEEEVREAFGRVMPLVALGGEPKALARLWFFETVVRLHRAGEHAPYTGLKPAGQGVGPVIPLAEQAIDSGDVEPVYRRLAADLRDQLDGRLKRVEHLAVDRDSSVAAGREHVHELLGFQVYAHHVYRALHQDSHGEAHDDEH